MGTLKVSGADAWLAATKSAVARWSDNIERFSSKMAEVVHSPKFVFDRDDKFFCIGSCFARNIEEHLIYQDINVLSRKLICPKKEWKRRPNGLINKFTPHSIRNELEWVLNPPAIDVNMFEEQADGWRDLQLCRRSRPVSLERAIERREYLIREYFSSIRDASVVIITLGLNEVWFDRASGRHLNAPPSFYATRRDPERYELHIADVDDIVIELEEIRRLILNLHASSRIIITVSPVPLRETFSGKDILVANMYSKSTLRAAAEVFTRSYDNVDYFPSYDMISMSPRFSVYEQDCRHVSDATVGQMMQTFIRLYLGFEATPTTYNELAYLEANPDIEAAVRRGELISGFDHWRQCCK